LQKLGNVIKQFDGISPSDAHVLAQELKLGFEVDNLLNELSKISGKSIKDIDSLFKEVAKENVEFSEVYYKARNKEYVKYEDNEQLQRLVEGIKKETNGLFTNLTNSKNVGFTLKDSKGNITYKPLAKLYNDLIDEAVFNVSTGVTDYQSAMRNTMNQLADSGIKIHEEKLGYKNGYNKRIDSSIRQAVLEGIRKINIDVQEQIGKEIGADGVEISVHFPCAEDHLDVQGRQYSNKEFDRLQGNLDRPIGDYNCRHFVFSIIMGVDNPQYSDNALFKMKQRNNATFEYEGKTYNKYEATQVQRSLETAIRKQKDRQIIARASGNKEEIANAQSKISQLTSKYNDFSKKADLPTYKQRMTVTGYHRVSVK
jgi:hypothetical protein